MLPPSLHGQGERHGFVPQLIAAARAKGVSAYIGDGTSRWPAVHVKDAASLYRPAIEQAPAGAVLNAVGDERVLVLDVSAETQLFGCTCRMRPRSARVRPVRGGRSVLGGRPTLGSVRGCA
jgi:nucleoside-diphosphate-sugar epimerase